MRAESRGSDELIMRSETGNLHDLESRARCTTLKMMGLQRSFGRADIAEKHVMSLDTHEDALTRAQKFSQLHRRIGSIWSPWGCTSGSCRTCV